MRWPALRTSDRFYYKTSYTFFLVAEIKETSKITEEEQQLARDYLCDQYTPKEELHQSFISLIMRSNSKICIIPIQDYMGCDNTCRMNTPSTIGINRRWRIKQEELSKELQEDIFSITKRYGRENLLKK